MREPGAELESEMQRTRDAPSEPQRGIDAEVVVCTRGSIVEAEAVHEHAREQPGSEHEPLVLPTRIPNLLINGSEGIAVGMATRIPPHNLAEIVSATLALIENPNIDLDGLMEHVQGPDFPTAASIRGLAGIREAYATGRGSIRIRAKTDIETDERTDRSAIIVHELPYQVNKARLLEKIAQLIREKSIEGISDLRDESDRTGMRIYIELKRDAIPQVVLNHLFKKTELQKSFGINMLAIVAGQPRVLPLKDVLSHFIDFRRDVVTRRCLYELRKAQERLHILVALRKALDMIDEVVRTIRASSDADQARAGLMALLEIDEVQASAILDMRLQRLTNLEINKLLEEIAEIEARIARLNEILSDEQELLGVIRQELLEVRDQFGEERRTVILPDDGELSLEDLIADEDEVLTLTHSGYIKRTPIAEYRTQRRGGKGLKGMGTKNEDVVEDVWVTNTHASLLVFTSAGKAYVLKVHEVPAGGRNARGKPVVHLIPVQPDEKVRAIVPFDSFDETTYVLAATRSGTVKKTSLSLFRNIHAAGIIGIRLAEDDELINVTLCREGDNVLLVTSAGRCIRFDQANVRPMGRATTGVRGINLRDGDEVVAMAVMTRDHIEASRVMAGLEGIVEDAPEAPIDPDAEATTDADAEPIDAELETDELDDAASADVHDDDSHLVVTADADEELTGLGDHVAGCRTVLTITENGFGKRTRFEEYRVQNRGGYGIIAIKSSERNGRVAGCRLVDDTDQLIIITDGGKIIRTRTSDVSISGRNTLGVRLMRLSDQEHIVGVARYAEREAGLEPDDAPDDTPDDTAGEPHTEPADDATTASTED